MKPSYMNIWRYSATFVLYFVFEQIAENLFPYSSHIYKDFNDTNFFFLYFLFIALKTFILIWLISCINQNKLRLITTIFFIMYGLQTVMILTEIWFFRNVYGFLNYDISIFFIQNLITLALTIPAAVWINRAYYKKITLVRKINVSLKWVYLSLVYLIIYFSSRYITIYLSDSLKEVYHDSENYISFFDYVKTTIAAHKGIVFFQVLRGLLWIVFLAPVLYWYNGKEKYKPLLIILMMLLLPTIQILFPSPILGFTVKTAHAIGISASNIIYAILIYIAFSFKNSTKSHARNH